MKITKRSGLIALAVVVCAIGVILLVRPAAAPPAKPTGGQPRAATKPAAGFDKKKYSLISSSSLWVIVNKKHLLQPTSYAPSTLVVPDVPLRANITDTERQVSGVMAEPLKALVAAAKNQNINLNLQSGYRSYDFQKSLYAHYVAVQGQAAADEQSARAGYSEHQTGLAADLGSPDTPGCNVELCFATTAPGKWLAANAFAFGFIIRYPADGRQTTGYEYEPWHIRYVGTELAGEMHAQGVETMEAFFGVAAAPNY